MQRFAVVLAALLASIVVVGASCPPPVDDGDGTPCTTAADCNIDETCRDGECHDNGGEGEGAEGEGAGACNHNALCEAGEDGSCDDCGGGACADDRDCPDGAVCFDGFCTGGGEGEGAGGCNLDGICESGEDVSCSDCGDGGCNFDGLCEANEDVSCVDCSGGGGCHNSAECTSQAESCVSPDDPPQCGAPPPFIEDECTDNVNCSTDGSKVCDRQFDACNTSHLACVDACVDATTCGSTENCNDGRCEAQACQDNVFFCPTWTACGVDRPDPLGDDRHHGCVEIPCTQDFDCPFPSGGFVPIVAGGFCVNLQCASGIGTCQLPVP